MLIWDSVRTTKNGIFTFSNSKLATDEIAKSHMESIPNLSWLVPNKKGPSSAIIFTL